MNSKIKNLTVYAVLTAIMAVMAFSHLGYIKIGLAEITLMSIPVIIGISYSGYKGGLFFGTVFGLTSFLQCFGTSAFGATLFGINPVFTVITCFIPRILMGLIAGLIFDLLKKRNIKSAVNYIILSVAAPLLNTILFLTSLIAFFGRTDYILGLAESVGATNMFVFAVSFFGLNAVLEVVVCAIAGPVICKALEKVNKQ